MFSASDQQSRHTKAVDAAMDVPDAPNAAVHAAAPKALNQANAEVIKHAPGKGKY